jgi:site-specific recombinase XerD
MKLTRAERDALCQHEDSDIRDFLMAVETGRIGVIHDGGRGSSRKPRKDGTLRSYAGTLNSVWKHLDHTPWGEVTERQLEDFLHRPLDDEDADERSVSTATQNLSTIRGFYKWLMAYKRVAFELPDDNPSAFVRLDEDRLKRAQDRSPVADAMWLTIVRSPKLGPDDRLALGLGYYVGLRREEIVSVSPEAIDPMHQRILFVDRKGGKTKKGLEYGELVGLLGDHRPEVAEGAADWVQLMEFYAKYRTGETTLVPDGGVKYSGQRLIDRMEHHILPEAGLDPKAFTPHQLRHSFGTNMALCGLDVDRIADQMSHSSTETTARYIDAAGQVKAFRQRQKGESGAAAAWRQAGTPLLAVPDL